MRVIERKAPWEPRRVEGAEHVMTTCGFTRPRFFTELIVERSERTEKPTKIVKSRGAARFARAQCNVNKS